MDGFAHGSADPALALYESLLSSDWLDSSRRLLGLGGRSGLFTPALTIWLGIRRRLLGGLSVERTWLSCSSQEAIRLSQKSTRAHQKLSLGASGLDHARHTIPLALIQAASDHLFAEARALLGFPSAGWFLLDGSSLTLEPSPSLSRAFPPLDNKNGKSRWPVMKVALAHDLQTGLALRPEWGSMYGPTAVSEQALAHRLLERIPPGYGVIADRNFGILQVAWALRDRPMLIRLTDVRAKSMLPGKSGLESDQDLPMVWSPSAWEKTHHPEFESEMALHGRLVIRHVLGAKKQPTRVCLFTNDLTSSPETLVELYAQRWNIETDLRTLKQTVGLESLGVKSPEMAEKELVLAVCAYNLVRTLMALAAERAGVPARRLSFSRARSCVEINASRGVTTEAEFQALLQAIAGRTLPQRQRSFPRQKYRRREKFPSPPKAEREN